MITDDFIKDSIDAAQNIALAGMKGGYEIAQRENAEKIAALEIEKAELVALFAEWLTTELSQDDEEYQPWLDSFTERVRAITGILAPCPFPIEGDNGTSAQCIANGHCGCDNTTKETK